MNNDFEKLAEHFARFPGIGARQAKRFVYYVLRENPKIIEELISLIQSVKKNIATCARCFRYFTYDGIEICDVCANTKTDASQLIVVEKDADLESIRKTNLYKGFYFVLGGLVPIADTETVKRTRSQEFLKRITEEVALGKLKEVIFAFPINPSGEHTESYLREKIKSMPEAASLKISTLGRGLSTGSELEYADKETLANALGNRK